eukprot:COSAG03_NODE_15975_length_415_cov_0.762658_2_plen_69_part_00
MVAIGAGSYNADMVGQGAIDHGFGKWQTTYFFMVYVVFVFFILLNFFLAIVMQAYDKAQVATETEYYT